MSQSLIPLKAQLKLQQRHLREWNALIVNQKRILDLIKEETAQKISATSQDNKACVELIYKRSARIIKLLKRQKEERQQMKNRQQEEKKSLEQLIEDSQLSSND